MRRDLKRGASDATIYGDPHVNHAFRAWHDATHFAHGLGFHLAGEKAVCEHQIADLYRAHPNAPKLWAALLSAEIVGQAEAFLATGSFPVDQAQFTREALL